MKESTVDRRIRKTKHQLRQSLTALLKEKPVQDITVRELADLADINRGTFYLHYRDVYDLLNQIEEELLGELESVLEKYQPGNILPNISKIFTEVYELVQRNSEIVGILMGDNGEWNGFCASWTGWSTSARRAMKPSTPIMCLSSPAAWDWFSTGWQTA